MLKIKINPLDPSSIDAAQAEIKRYQNWLTECTKELITTVAEYGVSIANVRFSDAVYAGVNDVTVDKTASDDTHVTIKAHGSAVMFIEYGTGLYMGDHPERPAGFGPGSYGQGRGKSPYGWLYKGAVGSNPPTGTAPSSIRRGLVHTHGGPANKCMYLTVQDLQDMLPEIIAKIFVWKG